MRIEIRAHKKLLVAANMELTESEAKTFWPIYEQYQTDLQTINRRLASLVESYAADSRGKSLTSRDGNVYENTGGGWQHYDNGGWNNVQAPPSQNFQAQQQARQAGDQRSAGASWGSGSWGGGFNRSGSGGGWGASQSSGGSWDPGGGGWDRGAGYGGGGRSWGGGFGGRR